MKKVKTIYSKNWHERFITFLYTNSLNILDLNFNFHCCLVQQSTFIHNLNFLFFSVIKIKVNLSYMHYISVNFIIIHYNVTKL